MDVKKVGKFIFLGLVVVFLCTYFIELSGYYEYNLANKKNLTEDQIKQFEADVKEGKEIDLSSYLEDMEVDYSNKLTRTASDASIKLNEYLKNLLGSTFKILGRFVQ